MKKICILFPGMGYTTQKPLLYYSGKLALSKDYELVQITYDNMPPKVIRDPEVMRQAYEAALDSARRQLADIRWDEYSDILIVGKSVGTAVAASFADTYIFSKGLNAKLVYLTPVAETYKFVKESVGIAFHGNDDPWADTDEVIRLSEQYQIPLHIYEGANHSLETGDVETDLRTLQDVMEYIASYI